jgi:hypothetical protein
MLLQLYNNDILFFLYVLTLMSLEQALIIIALWSLNRTFFPPSVVMAFYNEVERKIDGFKNEFL